MDYNAEFIKFGKKIIEVEELQRIVKVSDYYQFHQIVTNAVENGNLEEVKASLTNGKFLPLFNKYRIIPPDEDLEYYSGQIRKLSPRLNISGYMENIKIFKKHVEILSFLSDFLWKHEKLLTRPMSRNERSFSIWGREKFIHENYSQISDVLKFNSLDIEYLNFYETPEPFFEYIHSKQPETVLVLENKDIWFTLRRLMLETQKNVLLGEKLGAILYGEGNKITKPGVLQEYISKVLGNNLQKVKVLYFGDLDSEGIRIFSRVRSINMEADIKPFGAMYRLMIKLAKGKKLPNSNDKRAIDLDTKAFSQFIGENFMQEIMTIIENGQYIPQEIINYQVLSDLLK